MIMIELGRYQIDHVPRENRLCPLYKSKQIEDENHFLFQFQENYSCPLCSSLKCTDS